MIPQVLQNFFGKVFELLIPLCDLSVFCDLSACKLIYYINNSHAQISEHLSFIQLILQKRIQQNMKHISETILISLGQK